MKKTSVMFFGLMLIFLIILASMSLTSAACPSDMVSYWKLDGDATDFINGHDGTDSGVLWVRGLVNGAVKFDAGEHIIIPNSEDLHFYKADDFTLELLVNNYKYGGGQLYLDRGDSPNNRAYALEIGQLGEHTAEFTWWGARLKGDIGIKKDKWYHLAIVKQGTTFRLYVNGTLDKEVIIDRESYYADKYGWMGWGFAGGTNVYAYVDEVAIFERALTPAEVQEHFNNASAGCDYCGDCGLGASPECSDGIDNDVDGFIDFPNDLGCTSEEDNNETDPEIPCFEEDIIMNLFQSTNSLGALWNSENYNKEVCYSKIFGSPYMGENPHDCKGTNAIPDNKVAGLNDTVNAHAEEPDLDNYNVDVCYGNLICQYLENVEDCSSLDSGYECVVTLDDGTNSLLAECNSSDSYENKICCKPRLTSIEGVYWANMKNQPINIANLNDKVKLIVEGEELTGQINYTIYQCETVCDLTNGGITWFDKKVAETSTTWRAGKNSDGTLESGDYYFKTKLDNEAEYSTLDNDGDDRYLEVSDTQSNSKPFVNITGPKDRQIYFLQETLDFTAEITDEDDDFNYTWDLGDGIVKHGNSINLNNYQFLYAYNNTNQKDIVLIATDERNAISRDQISILIINSSYALAYIDEPKFGQAYGRVVNFDASGSYVVNSTYYPNGKREVVCLAGRCPVKTKGCPFESGGVGDCQIPVNDTPQPLSAVNFYWKFDNGIKIRNKTGLEGYEFTEMFASVGEHIVELTISLNPKSTTKTKFGVYFDDPTCYIYGGESYWHEGESINPSINDCYREDGVPRTDCCTLEKPQCNRNTGYCEEGALGCEQFDNNQCGDDNGAVAKAELESIVNCDQSDNFGTSGNCWNITTCRCEWDEDDDICGAVAENVIGHQDGEIYEEWDYMTLPLNIRTICNGGDTSSIGKCEFQFLTEDNCESTGFIERSWIINWIGGSGQPAWCKNDSDEIPCIGVAKLAFFTIVGLIVAIVLIVIIYIIIVSKKKKYSGKENKIKTKRKKRI